MELLLYLTMSNMWICLHENLLRFADNVQEFYHSSSWTACNKKQILQQLKQPYLGKFSKQTNVLVCVKPFLTHSWPPSTI